MYVLDQNIDAAVFFDTGIDSSLHGLLVGNIGSQNGYLTTLRLNAALCVLGGIEVNVDAEDLRPLSRENIRSCGAVSP